MKECAINRIITGRYVMEGAGVKLKRIIGFDDPGLTDPFLLFDHFGSDNPDDYIRGFPWHPHRGIETVTYMIGGEVEHQDSLGNKGVISRGDAQWMTAGSGIIHQEMPLRTSGRLDGFQLWVNLPGKEKMCEPQYRDILSDKIPLFTDNGISVKILSGKFKGITGAADDISGNPLYIDVTMDKDKELTIDLDASMNIFLYLFAGGPVRITDSVISNGSMIIFGKGDMLKIKTDEQARFITFAGIPLNEPVAWRGPIVMNTEEELDKAFNELKDGSFIKHRS